MEAESRQELPPPTVEALIAENARLRAELLEARSARRATGGGVRRWLVAALVVLASLTIVMSAVVLWGHRTVLSTDGWVRTVGPVIEDPDVVATLGEYGAGQLMIALDLRNRAEEALPANLRFLATPLTVAARGFTADVLVRVMSDPAFAEFWVGGQRLLHQTALSVLRGDSAAVQVYPDGAVRMNLFPLIDRGLTAIERQAGEMLDRGVDLPRLTAPENPAAARRELSLALGVDLPPDFGQIEVFRSEELLRLRRFVRAFDALALLLPVSAFALSSVALWASRRRRRTALQLGLGTAIGAALVYLLGAWAVDRAAAGVPVGAGGVVAMSVLGAARHELDRWLVVLFVVGLTAAGAAYAAGRPARLVAARDRVARIVDERRSRPSATQDGP